MFINGVLYNSEVWHNLTITDITILGNIDHQFLRYICNGHSKTQIELLYLETQAQPLRHIISIRRNMYLYNILNRNEEELVKCVYRAQKESPTRGDFVKLVENDLQLIEMDFN